MFKVFKLKLAEQTKKPLWLFGSLMLVSKMSLIGDFGLARDLVNEEFYLKQTKGLVPIKWMPPEAIVDKIYNTMTDV